MSFDIIKNEDPEIEKLDYVLDTDGVYPISKLEEKLIKKIEDLENRIKILEGV